MAPKKDTAASQETALATTQGSALAISAPDMLDGIEVEYTGLEEAVASDFKFGTLMLNFGGEIGGDVPLKTMWVNTLSETQEKNPILVLLSLHKSRQYRGKDASNPKKSVTLCSSWDNVTGKTIDGMTRRCEGCPDFEFRRVDGKPTRNCGEVHNVMAIHTQTNDIVILRNKRTAARPWQTFLSNTFLGKRALPGGRRENYPLFTFLVRLSAKIVDGPENSKYAVPVFEVVKDADGKPVIPSREEFASFATTAKEIRELLTKRPEDFEREPEAAHAGDIIDADAVGDTSFEFGGEAPSSRFADPAKASNRI